MWSRMVCRSGGWFLLITSLLILHHTHSAARRKRETVFVADPAGHPLSKPSNVPAKVGSPADLITPDRYEFYTFDESGELIKRLMTLEEIQEIIATGDGDDGHILTIAQSDINKPAVTFNFQPPSHVKVHSVVSNVQNVLKSEIEAQKNNPPKDGVFDTPDVSSSWSQILPAVFGNTGGNIAPDSLISPHVGPETDFIVDDKNEIMNPIIGDDVEKVNNAVYINNEKINFNSDLSTNTFIRPEDLLEGEVLQSKTTGEASTTKLIPTTAQPITKITHKHTQLSSMKIQTTDRTTIAIAETKEETIKPTVTQTKPSTISYKQTTSTPTRQSTTKPPRQTTSPIKQTSDIIIRQTTESLLRQTPETIVRRTTVMPIRQSSTIKQTEIPEKQTPLRQTTPAPIRKTTTIPVKQTSEAPARQTTASLIKQPSEIPMKQPSVLPIIQTTEPPARISTVVPIIQTTVSSVKLSTTVPIKETTEAPVKKSTTVQFRPTTIAPIRKTTTVPIRKTTQYFKETTKPSTVIIKQTTGESTKESSTEQIKESITTYSKLPLEEKSTITTIKPTSYVQINQNAYSTFRPVNFEVSSKPSTFKPVKTTIKLSSSPFTQTYSTQYINSTLPNIKYTMTTSKITKPTTVKITTPIIIKETTVPISYSNQISETQSSTERFRPTPSTNNQLKVQTTNSLNINITVPQIQQDVTKIPSQPMIELIRNFTQYQSSITKKPAIEVQTGTLKPIISSTENIRTTQYYKDKTQTQKQPETNTHIKISSSNLPSSPSGFMSTNQNEPEISQTTKFYQKPTSVFKTTTQKVITTPNIYTTPVIQNIISSTTQHEKPEIDINQIINQIALNLGNEPYDISTNRLSTYAPYPSNNFIFKPHITTYRPIIKDTSEHITKITSGTETNSYVSTASNKFKPEAPIKFEVKTSTEKFITNNMPHTSSVTKPAAELSESITNLISQIVDQKPTIVPVYNEKYTEKPNIYKQSTKYENILASSILPLTSKENDMTQNIFIKETTEAIKPTLSDSSVSNKIVSITSEQTTEKISVTGDNSEVNPEVMSTTAKITTDAKQTTMESYIPSGHYITKISSAEKPSPSTSKFEIYKTSNEPSITTIKKILTPEISTPKIVEIDTPKPTTPASDSTESDKPLKIDLLNAPTDDMNHEGTDDKIDNIDDYNEETMYDGSESNAAQDDELMEMLNKYSEMFHSSSEVEAKSDEIEDNEDITKIENKKVTSYKRTDIPGEEYNLFNTSLAPHTEKTVEIGNTSTESTNNKLQINNSPILETEDTNIVKQDNNKNKDSTEPKVEKLNETVEHKTDFIIKQEMSNTNDSKITNVNQNSETVTQTSEKYSSPFSDQNVKVSTVKPNADSLVVQVKNENKDSDSLPQKSENIQVITTIDSNEVENLKPSSTEKSNVTPTKNIINVSSTNQPIVEPVSFTVTPNTPLVKVTIPSKSQSIKQPVEFTTKSIVKPSTVTKSDVQTVKPYISTTKNIVQSTVDSTTKGTIQTKSESISRDTFQAKVESTTAFKGIEVETSSQETINSNINKKPSSPNLWTLVSTEPPPHKDMVITQVNHHPSHAIGQLHLDNDGEGLEKSTNGLNEDVYQFSVLCNELGFRYWNAIISNGIDPKRSLFVSPFAITSLLAMIFMATRGATSEEMNEILKLDDMVTFNPHIVFKNVTDSIEVSKRGGVATSAIIRELYSDRSKGRLLSFYKDRVQKFYSGHVEEVNFSLIGDIIRRRTNLLVKRQTWSKIPEYIKHNNLVMKPPLAIFSANIFQTDCSAASTDGRDGEMYFVVSPTIRQRRLVPVPAVVYRSGFLAGYVTELDATAVAIGKGDQIISTILVMPGQQGSIPRGDDIIDLERRLIDTVVKDDVWRKLLKSLKTRAGLELQIPRLSHRSVINGSSSLQSLGMKDLFDPNKANLAGLNGQDNDLHISDMILDNTFTTCGEGYVGDQHHVEVYPGDSSKLQRRLWRTPHRPLYAGDVGESWDDLRDYQRAFHDPLNDMSLLSIPLHLRPRQARLPDPIVEPPRLKFDRPFMYFVRHNPTGLILHMGRYNPRLLP